MNKPKNHHKPFARVFPATHPKAGQPTYFVEKMWNALIDAKVFTADDIYPYMDQYQRYFSVDIDAIDSLGGKIHTIRATGKVPINVGDTITPYIWLGKPYNSKQLVFTPPIPVTRVARVEIKPHDKFISISIDGATHIDAYGGDPFFLTKIAKNDGLWLADFSEWFGLFYPKFKGFEGNMFFFTNDKTSY